LVPNQPDFAAHPRLSAMSLPALTLTTGAISVRLAMAMSADE
jgi:hypothetical protein